MQGRSWLLAVVVAVGGACGGDEEGRGGGGDGGSGGSGGGGGTGPVERGSTAEECAAACTNAVGTCGLEPQFGTVAVCQEECPFLFTSEQATCMSTLACSADPVAECIVTQPCVEMCAHFYVDCEARFMDGSGAPLEQSDCELSCSLGAFSDGVIACVAAAECTDPAMDACLEG